MKMDGTLKGLLNSGETLIMPNAYDPISAKIIEYIGFSAVQCSGYSFSIENGYKNEGEIDLQTNLKITKEIVNSVSVPVMADAEDGYGDGDCLADVVKEFINIGASGMNIEDQDLHANNDKLQIISESSMLDKLKVAISVKNQLGEESFIINSRTDALLSSSNRNKAQKIAIERANKYIEAGADLCFVAYTKTLEEVKLLAKEINGPISIAAGLPYNIQEFSINDCIELGIARVSLPSFLIFSSMQAMIRNLKQIRDTGNFNNLIKDQWLLSDIETLNDILLGKKNH